MTGSPSSSLCSSSYPSSCSFCKASRITKPQSSVFTFWCCTKLHYTKYKKNCTLSIQVASFQPETLSFNELAPFLLAAGFFIGSGGLFPFVFFFFMTAFGLAFAFAVVAGLFFALPLPLELPFPLLDHLVHLSHSVLVYLLYLLLYLFIFFLSSSWLTDRALNVPSELKAVCAELPRRNAGEVV